MPQYGINPLTGKPVLLSRAEPGMGSGRAGVARMADLLSRLPDADLKGAVGLGVVPGGEQGRGARRAEMEQEGQPHAPETYRPLGGAQQNYRGNGRVVTIGGADYQAQNVMIVQTPKDAGDDAEEIGIQCGLDLTQIAIGSILATPIALVGRVVWGVGGASFEAEFDWMLGTRLSLTASFCQVSLALPENAPDGTPMNTFPAVNLRVDAALSYGRSAGSGMASPARRTLIPDPITLPPGNFTADMVIPPFATSFTIIDSASPTQTYRADVRGISGNRVAIFNTVTFSNAANLNEGTYPLPNGARYLSLVNTGAANGNPAVIFNLSL